MSSVRKNPAYWNWLDAIRERLKAATPGPWRIRRGEAGGGAFIIADKDGVKPDVTLGTVWGDAWCISTEEAEANVQLVAHAPEDIDFLLDALDDAHRDAEFWRDHYKGTLPLEDCGCDDCREALESD